MEQSKIKILHLFAIKCAYDAVGGEYAQEDIYPVVT